MYGVWDAGVANLNKSNLVQQTITELSGGQQRIVSDNTVNYDINNPSSGNFGWYIDLNVPANSGERVVIDPVVRAEQVFFGTLIPGSQVCSNAGGTGWVMVLDAENGGEPTGGGIDFNNDGNFDTDGSGTFVSGVKFNDGIPVGLGFLGGTNKLYITDTSDTGGNGVGNITGTNISELSTANLGRLSWQELIE